MSSPAVSPSQTSNRSSADQYVVGIKMKQEAKYQGMPTAEMRVNRAALLPTSAAYLRIGTRSANHDLDPVDVDGVTKAVADLSVGCREDDLLHPHSASRVHRLSPPPTSTQNQRTHRWMPAEHATANFDQRVTWYSTG